MQRLTIFWWLVALTSVLYLLVIFYAGPPLLELATVPIADLKLTGYDLAYFRTLLAEADPTFPEAYVVFSTSWDLAFPLVASFCFAFGMWTFGLSRSLIGLALLTGVADLTENALAVRLITGGIDALSVGTIRFANFATMAKWLLYLSSILLLFYGFGKSRRKAKEEVTT